MVHKLLGRCGMIRKSEKQSLSGYSESRVQSSLRNDLASNKAEAVRSASIRPHMVCSGFMAGDERAELFEPCRGELRLSGRLSDPNLLR